MKTLVKIFGLFIFLFLVVGCSGDSKQAENTPDEKVEKKETVKKKPNQTSAKKSKNQIKIKKMGMNKQGVMWMNGDVGSDTRVWVNNKIIKKSGKDGTITYRLPEGTDQKSFELKLTNTKRQKSEFKVTVDPKTRRVSFSALDK